MSKKMSIHKLATVIQNRLLDEGFVIQRYDAYKTKSIYFKLDYGVANSIRISDHEGKQQLHYRYNIGSHIKEYKETDNTYPQYYYPVSELNRMFDDIIKAKQHKLGLYGQANYNYTMDKYFVDGQNKKGFWKQARIINKKEKKDHADANE